MGVGGGAATGLAAVAGGDSMRLPAAAPVRSIGGRRIRAMSLTSWRTWVAVGWAVGWVVITVLMLMPVPDVPQVSSRLAHFVVFLVMTGAALAFCLTHRALLVVTLLAGLFALGLEYAQSLVPWRHFDLMDLGANVAGVLSGYVLAATLLLTTPSRTG